MLILLVNFGGNFPLLQQQQQKNLYFQQIQINGAENLLPTFPTMILSSGCAARNSIILHLCILFENFDGRIWFPLPNLT